MKVAAGYVGSVAVLKRLIKWNLIDLPLKTKMGMVHINPHRYMGRGQVESPADYIGDSSHTCNLLRLPGGGRI